MCLSLIGELGISVFFQEALFRSCTPLYLQVRPMDSHRLPSSDPYAEKREGGGRFTSIGMFAAVLCRSSLKEENAQIPWSPEESLLRAPNNRLSPGTQPNDLATSGC